MNRLLRAVPSTVGLAAIILWPAVEYAPARGGAVFTAEEDLRMAGFLVKDRRLEAALLRTPPVCPDGKEVSSQAGKNTSRALRRAVKNTAAKVKPAGRTKPTRSSRIGSRQPRKCSPTPNSIVALIRTGRMAGMRALEWPQRQLELLSVPQLLLQ